MVPNSSKSDKTTVVDPTTAIFAPIVGAVMFMFNIALNGVLCFILGYIYYLTSKQKRVPCHYSYRNLPLSIFFTCVFIAELVFGYPILSTLILAIFSFAYPSLMEEFRNRKTLPDIFCDTIAKTKEMDH